jgi:hypothetical protein
MELSEIWLAYVNEHMVADAGKFPPVEITASQTLERLFELHPIFTSRWDAIMSVKYTDAFDEEANNALAHLAMTDSFAAWDELSVGAWRVLVERLQYCEVVLVANMAAAPNAVLNHLPIGLTRDQEARALLLRYLLEQGRTIDRQILPVKEHRAFTVLSPSQALRSQ